MKRCVDTNAYSRLMKGNAALQSSLEEADVLILPVIVLGELHSGFDGGTQKKKNEDRLELFLAEPSVRIQDVTYDIARRYALVVNELRRTGTPIPTNDIWIAATALELGARLVSYDAHFRKIGGLIVESPGE